MSFDGYRSLIFGLDLIWGNVNLSFGLPEVLDSIFRTRFTLRSHTTDKVKATKQQWSSGWETSG